MVGRKEWQKQGKLSLEVARRRGEGNHMGKGMQEKLRCTLEVFVGSHGTIGPGLAVTVFLGVVCQRRKGRDIEGGSQIKVGWLLGVKKKRGEALRVFMEGKEEIVGQGK